MLFQVIEENGQKKIQPLTADAGAGNPVGTIIPMYKKSSPSGYLYCDGSTFDETAYPLLYAYLGSNVLPDYREFALVGAEENTTDVYNASTNPNGTIHDHDVYAQGEGKDDQLQQHRHYAEQMPVTGGSAVNVAFGGTSQNLTLGNVTGSYRFGGVTRGKRKAVYFYIKATSGLSENAQDNVINTLNEQRSYSTSEVNTGKKWIDGKPIYEITIKDNNINTTPKVLYTIPNLSSIVKIQAIYKSSTNIFPAWYAGSSGFNWARGDGNNLIWEYGSGVTAPEEVTVTIEYTKTTD